MDGHLNYVSFLATVWGTWSMHEIFATGPYSIHDLLLNTFLIVCGKLYYLGSIAGSVNREIKNKAFVLEYTVIFKLKKYLYGSIK